MDVLKMILLGIAALIIVGAVSVFSGTIVWLIWPIAVPAAFPGLVSNGVIAGQLSWWSAVLLTWLFCILIKASQSNKNKNS